MSMDHKAFVFDYTSFERELRPRLERALHRQETGELKEFIRIYRDVLKDPCEGMPLDEAWEHLIESDEPDQYGDICLTKYYDPASDIGLGPGWLAAQSHIEKAAPGKGALLLGRPLHCGTVFFDPGKMGSYFASPDDVAQGLSLLQSLSGSGDVSQELDAVMAMLERARETNMGLYVTF